MAMDSIGRYLIQLDDPARRAHCANYLLNFWQAHSEWDLEGRYPQIVQLCRDMRGGEKA